MSQQKITFTNSSGDDLSAVLEVPFGRQPENFAVFAHCFTCNKNFRAVRRISRSLRENGFGVLSLDFTGLGESGGDFSETTFSSSVDDLLSAAAYLRENHSPAGLMIGHSLGGAAAILAAGSLEEVSAVATIGAPSRPQHVGRLIMSGEEQIRSKGFADVSIGGTTFRIKEQFLNDLRDQDLASKMSGMKKAILILHSPQDRIVGIENAAELFGQARHPKSFVSLDGADHLLSNAEDGDYAGKVIASWASRYLVPRESEQPSSGSRITAYVGREERYTTEIMADSHRLLADEPLEVGGKNLGPSPYQLVGAGLAACTVMTLRMYAERKKWDLNELSCVVGHEKIHIEDCADCDDPNGRIDHFTVELEFPAELEIAQVNRLMDIAARCPVHKTLKHRAVIDLARRPPL